MRVLISIYPEMYRQTLTHALKAYRPNLEIKAVNPSILGLELGFFEPDLLITSEVSSEVEERVFSSVEILYNDSMDAHVRVNDTESRRVSDMDLEELLAILDQTQEFVSRPS
jgi:hypothetical protein